MLMDRPEENNNNIFKYEEDNELMRALPLSTQFKLATEFRTIDGIGHLDSMKAYIKHIILIYENKIKLMEEIGRGLGIR